MKANLSREDIEDLKNQQGFDIVMSLENTLVNELIKSEFFRRLKDIKKSINKRFKYLASISNNYLYECMDKSINYSDYLNHDEFINNLKRIKNRIKNKK